MEGGEGRRRVGKGARGQGGGGKCGRVSPPQLLVPLRKERGGFLREKVIVAKEQKDRLPPRKKGGP